MSAAETSKLTARITWLSVSVGLSLALLKTVVWWFSGSVSLLASAADSGLDFVAALGTFWAVRVAVGSISGIPSDRQAVEIPIMILRQTERVRMNDEIGAWKGGEDAFLGGLDDVVG